MIQYGGLSRPEDVPGGPPKLASEFTVKGGKKDNIHIDRIEKEGMSSAAIENSNSNESPDFCWGKKAGVGGKKKEVQFYKSFTYDCVEYALYDCVYMYNMQNEQYPYIGKLTKIWENGDKSKKIKVQWFFRASEISHWLKTYNLEASENELFFATGEGLGLANVNPLEAIAGKCFVVCISRDSRNPLPLAEHLQMAHYVFYRTFDVRQCTISDNIDDRVGGLEARYLFNKQETEMITGPNIDLKPKEEDNRITVVFEETLQLLGGKKPRVVESMKRDGDPNELVAKEDIEANHVLVNDESFDGLEKEQLEDTTVSSIQVKGEYSSEPANEIVVQEILECSPYNIDGRPFEKVKPDKNATMIKSKVAMKGEQSTSSREDIKISTIDSFKERRKPDIEKDVVVVKDIELEKDSNYLDDRPSKIPKVEDLVKFSEVKKKNHLEVSADDAKAVEGKAVIKEESSTSNLGALNISTLGYVKESRNFDTGKDLAEVKDTKFGKVSCLDDRPSKKQKIEDLVKLSKVEKKYLVEKPSDGGEVKDNNQMDNLGDGGEVKGRLVVGISVGNKREVMVSRNSTSTDVGPLKEKSTAKINKFTEGSEKINAREVLEQKVIHHENTSELAKNSCKLDKDPRANMGKHTKSSQKNLSSVDEGPPPGMEGRDKGPLKEKHIGKTSVPIRSSFVVDERPTSGVDRFDLGSSKYKPSGKSGEPLKSSLASDKGPLEKKLDKSSSLLTNYRSSKILESSSTDVGKICEVTQRPNFGKGKWYTSSPWENMKDAHDERRIILLQNLDPEYTSGEVEDILWSAFNVNCSVKMVQQTTFSSHHGQALAIFKKREDAERVVGKLNEGCLLISNRRALVGSIANFPRPNGKQCNFVGHLFIDKIKHKMMREKDALSTSHYSQSNTIEYELAMEWCLLQSRYDLAWESLFKHQGAEFSKCMDNFSQV